jgi:8-oxo-dGTP pyrophosphatase MutT (NUDIX family)
VDRHNDPSYPPRGSWDARLTQACCPKLVPVDIVHENPWFSVRNRGGYFTVEYRFTHVAILPVIDDRWVVMVRVKRPVINDIPLEFPAGGAYPGEEPTVAAARELGEETGILIEDLGRFAPMTPIAESSTRIPRLSYFFRLNMSEGEFAARSSHDDEISSVERIPVGDLPGMMNRGTIYVSVSLAMIGLFFSSRLA